MSDFCTLPPTRLRSYVQELGYHNWIGIEVSEKSLLLFVIGWLLSKFSNSVAKDSSCYSLYISNSTLFRFDSFCNNFPCLCFVVLITKSSEISLMQVYVSLIYQTTSNGSVLLNIDVLYISDAIQKWWFYVVEFMR